MKWLFAACTLVSLSHCDRAVTPTPGDQISATSSRECPLLFEKSQWCAAIAWTTGPSSDIDSHFEIRFWPGGSGGNTLENPPEGFSAFLRMVCCGSIYKLGTVPIAPGVFRGTAQFGPGTWELVLRLQNGVDIDETSIHYRID